MKKSIKNLIYKLTREVINLYAKLILRIDIRTDGEYPGWSGHHRCQSSQRN